MAMSYGVRGKPGKETFFVSDECHPQTIDVVKTRAHARGVHVVVGDWRKAAIGEEVFGVLLQYPATNGAVYDYRQFCERAHAVEAVVTVATDLMSLVLLTPPGEWGADICVGNSQRFGVPLGFGGPHAAFFCDEGGVQAASARDESSACRATRTASRRCAWRCRRASSTSAATRRRATSAPRRCCSR